MRPARPAPEAARAPGRAPGHAPGRGAADAVPRVWWLLVRGGTVRDRARLALMAGGAALATFFLLAAATVLAVRDDYTGRYFTLVDEPGLRGGTALALALLVLPPIGFCYQASRLAAATRDRRLAALRLAGATPREARALGGFDAAAAGLAGSVTGLLGHLLCQRAGRALLPPDALVYPFDVTLPAAVAIGAPVLVTAGGVAAGLRAGTHVVASPLRVTSTGGARPAPRGRAGMSLLAAGATATVLPVLVAWLVTSGIVTPHPALGGVLPALAVGTVALGAALLLTGLAAASSWLVWRRARRVAARAADARTLLAARMLEARPRGWGRALTVVGLVVAIGTAAGWSEWEILNARTDDSFYLISYALVDLALLLAMAIAAAAIAVHQAEALLDGRRAFAALSAAGAPAAELSATLVREARLAAMPVCVTAAVVGGLAPAPLLAYDAAGAAYVLVRGLVLIGLAVGACVVVAAASGPLARRVSTPAELRYE